jgi:digeranylgeranylglycerophospholipid reductase
MMKSSYDVVVVGGGPSGSMSAKLAAEGGVSVCLLEKDRDIGYPVRCGEAIGDSGLRKFVEPKDSWFAAHLDSFSMTAPNGTSITADFTADKGYILNRRVFDYDLARLASDKGAEIFTKAYVYGLIIEDGFVRGVKLEYLGKKKEIRAKIVIGADGVESRVGRWAGIRTQLKMKDMESGFQYTLANVNIPQNRMDFFVGKNYAPGGYVWIFPKGNGIANVGIGVSGTYSKEKSSRKLLDDFVKEKFPESSILTTVCGGIPCDKPLKKPVKSGLILVGDAGHQVNPVTGGGISSGMTGGWIAGQVSANLIRKNKVDEKSLTIYTDWIHREFGKNYSRIYNIKNAISKFTDEDLNSIADKIKKLPREKRTLTKIFSTALIKKPLLVIDVIKVFAGI